MFCSRERERERDAEKACVHAKKGCGGGQRSWVEEEEESVNKIC